jgi:flagellin
MAINTNVSSATLVRAIKTATTNETSTINKLSSGKRINRAADDAAGLTINEKLTSKLRGITKAQGNIGDALSVIQRTYGGLSTVMENLQKIRELMVKAANGTNGVDELDYIQSEINDNVAIIEGTRASGPEPYVPHGGFTDTLYNGYGNEVFRGTSIIPLEAFKKDFQVGPDPSDIITLDFTNTINLDNAIDTSVGAVALGTLNEGASATLWQINIGGTTQSLHEKFLSLPPTKTGTLNDVDIMIKNLSRMMSVTDKYNAKFTAAFDKLEADKISYSGFKSQVQDTDYAKTASDLTQNQIQKQSAVSVLTQANAQMGFVLNLLP